MAPPITALEQRIYRLEDALRRRLAIDPADFDADVTLGAPDAGLRWFWKKVYAMQQASGTPYPHVKWLMFGDSMATDMARYYAPYLQKALGGPAGAYFLMPTEIGGITINSTTGSVTSNTADFDAFPGGLSEQYATAATRTYGIGGGTFTCDQIKVYYVKGPASAKDGGNFKIQVDGVDQGGFTNVSTVAGSISLGIATITPTLGAHNVTVVCLTGPIRILGVGMENTSIRGFVPISPGQGGISLLSAQTSAWANFATFLADVQPDVCTIEVKDPPATTFPTGVTSCFNAFLAGRPTMDVIGQGSGPVLSNNADQVLQNVALKKLCQSYGYIYWDGYTPLVSWDTVNTLGWGTDTVHLDTPAWQYKAARFLDDMGLTNLLGQSAPFNIAADTVFAKVEVDLGKTDSDRMGKIVADAASDNDLQIRARRWLKFMSLDGVTERARLDLAGGGTDFLPQFVKLGTANAGLYGVNSTNVAATSSNSSIAYTNFQALTIFTANVAANVSGAVTANVANGGVQLLTLTANLTSFAFSNFPSGAECEVHFIQGAGGPWTLAGFNASIHFAGGAAPTFSATIGWRDILTFRNISGTYYETDRSLAVR